MQWKQERVQLLTKIQQLETENQQLRQQLETAEKMASMVQPQSAPVYPAHMAATLSQLTGVLGQVSTVLGQLIAAQMPANQANAAPAVFPTVPAAEGPTVPSLGKESLTAATPKHMPEEAPAAEDAPVEPSPTKPEELADLPGEAAVDSVPEPAAPEEATLSNQDIPQPEVLPEEPLEVSAADDALPASDQPTLPPLGAVLSSTETTEEPADAVETPAAEAAVLEEPAEQSESSVSEPEPVVSASLDVSGTPEEAPAASLEDAAVPEGTAEVTAVETSVPEEPAEQLEQPAAEPERGVPASEDVPQAQEDLQAASLEDTVVPEEIPEVPAAEAPVSEEPVEEQEQPAAEPEPEAPASEDVPEVPEDIPSAPVADAFVPEETPEAPTAEVPALEEPAEQPEQPVSEPEPEVSASEDAPEVPEDIPSVPIADAIVPEETPESPAAEAPAPEEAAEQPEQAAAEPDPEVTTPAEVSEAQEDVQASPLEDTVVPEEIPEAPASEAPALEEPAEGPEQHASEPEPASEDFQEPAGEIAEAPEEEAAASEGDLPEAEPSADEALNETEDGELTLFEDDEDAETEYDPDFTLTLGTPIEDPNLRSITATSPKELKVDLFWAFFCPREDVYAKRWEDAKTGKSGYNFVCSNLWDSKYCPKCWDYYGSYKPQANADENGKSKGKKDKGGNLCNGCPNRCFTPLTREAVLSHLRKTASPSDVIGMYSILPGDTCKYLAMDFDEEDWQDCVTIIRKICREWTIPCAVERSRSGNGAHIWIFFSEEVKAKDARLLGSYLITEASKRSKSMKLNAYDRMFPAQDTMPSGGFGSLIALPFQGCVAKGKDPLQFNSVFVDENFQTIPDQWAYLAGLYRLSNADLLAHLQLHQRESATGFLVQNQEDNGPQQFSRYRKPMEKITAKDFSGKAHVIRANMLYLPMKDLTARGRDRLMRLAAFPNRDFYQMQGMRKPIWDIPRVIYAAEDRGEYLALPRGCQKSMEDLFRERDIPYTIEDQTSTGTPIDVTFVGSLWPDQEPAAEAMLKHDMGVLSASTAFGKTVIGAWLIAQRKVNTLVLVDRESLQSQWMQRLEQFLLLPEPKKPVDPNAKPKRGRKPKSVTDPCPIGQIGGGVNRPTGVVDVATFQSLWDKNTGEVNPIVRNYGMVIVDECHHAAADMFQKVVKEADARYLCGLSARPNRQDGKGPLVRFTLGPIRYQVDAKEQANKDGLTRVLIPRFTNFRQPFTLTEPWEYNDACQAMTDDADRNARIVQDVKDALEQGRSPIVLTQRVEHAKKLEALMADLPAKIITLTGQATHKERRAKQEMLLQLKPEEPLVLIATGQYAGEGFDLARLDTLMLVMPVSSKDLIYQFVGRLHRVYKTKATVYVYDYVDHEIPMLLRMYHKRLRAYAENAYSVRSNSTVPPEGNRLFTEKDYRNTFQDDLSQAKQQVILSGRLLTQTKVQDFLKRLRPGVSAELFLPATEDLKPEEEASLATPLELFHIRNIPVYRIPGCCQEFAVLDQKLLWYGGLDLLGKPDTESGCMRLQSPELSADLLHLANEWRQLATAEQTRIPM